MKKFLKNIKQWIFALIIAAIIMNLVFSFYNTEAGWINRTAGSTLAIYTPNSYIVYGTEGRGHHKTDSRGYVNDNDVLADNYVIAIGASHTQGKEVEDGERYTDLLNSWCGYGENSDTTYVYNVSQSAYYFPKIVKGFSALLQEFPGASKIIIEIGTTEFETDELEDALNQREYDESQTGQNILSTLSLREKISIYIKKYSPLIYNINSQVNSIKEIKNSTSNSNSSESKDLSLYEEDLENVFELLTSTYKGEIIILYHPTISLKDGDMIIDVNETDDSFREVCQKYNITFVDMSEKFEKEYQENCIVPYGFSNSSLGQGHLNADGHKMIAEELMKVVED